MIFCQSRIAVNEASAIGEARREANRVEQLAGLGSQQAGKAALIATELATNLSRYAPGGEILFRSYALGPDTGLEIMAVDPGPGMPDVGRCLTDGFSTGGSAGQGLGAVRRLASEFDIFSTAPGGTVIVARVHKSDPERPRAEKFQWGAVNLPDPRERACGDTWRLANHRDGLALLVADGLGHGEFAAQAADAAADAFTAQSHSPPAEILAAADRKMRGTRGAAVACASWNLASGGLAFAGVGNIAASLRAADSTKGRGLISHNGTVGVEMRKLQAFDYEAPPGTLLILHSDGLQSRWTFDPYPGLMQRHPALIAGVLYRDFYRGRDDVTVCVLRNCVSRA
jgi:anti-sigma regulatory factor (Ser/Thr protein kinase)